jgi:hypothetical protein
MENAKNSFKFILRLIIQPTAQPHLSAPTDLNPKTSGGSTRNFPFFFFCDKCIGNFIFIDIDINIDIYCDIDID